MLLYPGGVRTLLPFLALATATACADPASLLNTENVATDDVDLLFVIDNSGSMQTEQQLLAKAYADFVEEAGRLGGDVNLGVVTTDLGTGEAFGINGCSATGDAARVAHLEIGEGREYESPADASEAFRALVTIEDPGCGFEQPLEAMRRALSEPGDFLRPGAVLAVVFVTDEDDCSAKDPQLFAPENDSVGPLSSFRCVSQGVVCDGDLDTAGYKTNCRSNENSDYLYAVSEYADFLRDLEASEDGPGRLVISGIMGRVLSGAIIVNDDGGLKLSESRCPGGETNQSPYRLAELLESFPQQSVLHMPICAADYQPFFDTVFDILDDELTYCAASGGSCEGNAPCWAECPAGQGCDFRFGSFGVCDPAAFDGTGKY
jgi:hypothetical protein